MGLFLAMSSVVGANAAEVEASVRDYVATRQGLLERETAGVPEEQEGRLLESEGGATIVYPSHFTEWDEVSAKLSTDLKKPVFSFHIHDGDLWMFILFVNGKEAAKFNPISFYWEELEPEERARWLPSAAEVARHVRALRQNSSRRTWLNGRRMDFRARRIPTMNSSLSTGRLWTSCGSSDFVILMPGEACPIASK